MTSWFAVPAQGAALRISGLGLVIGRAPTCDLVLSEPEVSRRHVLLQFGLRGQLDVVPFPGARTTVNGIAIETPVAARDGDVLAFPGGATVCLALREGELAATTGHAWLLGVHGRRIGLRRADLSLGGGDDDVVIEMWPSGAAALTWRGEQPYLVPRLDGITRAGKRLTPNVAVALAPGDQLVHGMCSIDVLLETSDPAPTARGAVRITAITLETFPTGGVVTITTTHGEHRALLAERRFALACALLAPPAPYSPGQFVPDEIIIERVWPRNSSADRGDLNQLVFRLRADLKAAGLAGIELVERYSKGGAARAVVEATTSIQVRS
ncbi:MAG TPA: FHA domain-containing protein [Kofleriaceae bacterium]|nr:FHA domain-containing protein [Kofleriaceae bacterium]